MKKLYGLLACLLIIPAPSIAQSVKRVVRLEDQVYKEGVFSIDRQLEVLYILKEVRDMNFPENEPNNSSFTYYRNIDSCIKLNDSITASNYFLKTNYFHTKTTLEINNLSIEELCERLHITKKASLKYIDSFYDNTHSVSKQYETLRYFYENIQKKIKEISNPNSKKKDKLRNELVALDSIAFKYIHKQIVANGWPTIIDGSIYAAKIAVRDIEHFYKYLPYLKSAISKGYVSLNDAKKVYENRRYYYDFMLVKESLSHEHRTYDISSTMHLLKFQFLQTPELYNPILSEFQTNCSIIKDFMFVNYTNNPLKDGRRLGDAIHKDQSECLTLLDDIHQKCPNLNDNSGSMRVCRHLFLPNLYYANDKGFYYIIY